jgi:REP element-mobilizing transposase RayT
MQNREYFLGNIINDKIILNEFGKIVNKKINELKIYKNVKIDVYCVMPNHVHLILIIVGADPCVRPSNACQFSKHINLLSNDYLGLAQGSTGLAQGPTPTELTPTVGEYVKRLKSLTTFIYINNVKNNNWLSFNKRLWQRNYYEHIIRNEYELNRIRQYIQNNPKNWNEDRNNLI